MAVYGITYMVLPQIWDITDRQLLLSSFGNGIGIDWGDGSVFAFLVEIYCTYNKNIYFFTLFHLVHFVELPTFLIFLPSCFYMHKVTLGKPVSSTGKSAVANSPLFGNLSQMMPAEFQPKSVRTRQFKNIKNALTAKK